MADALRTYATEITKLVAGSTTAEETYYPALATLLSTLLKANRLPSDVRTNTKERRAGGGLNRPDLAVYATDGDGILLPVEIKLPSADARAVSMGTDRNDQVGRYLHGSNVCLVTNLRSVVCVVKSPEYHGSSPVPPAHRRILAEVDLLGTAYTPLTGAIEALEDVLAEALSTHSAFTDPADLARILALQARRAKAALPTDFNVAVESLRSDFAEALGVSFVGEEGEEFFRSSLIQTLFYGLFAGWILRRTDPDRGLFDWHATPANLPIPFLGALFYDINHPSRMDDLNVSPHLDAAQETFRRVDEERFFQKLRPPTLDDGTSVEGATAAGAITYFYEPFLEAFDPDLRRQLGVWYTPPEIVRYQVEKVHGLLKSHLGFPLGLADSRVVVLDPCCGTGAYLLETLAVVARTLREEGGDAEIGPKLRKAMAERIVGFEILTAPFVIAHLQIYLLLRGLDVKPTKRDRPAVYLTNALSGWSADGKVSGLKFPELQEERDAAQKVKQGGKILVIIGNPPYNRFAGEALDDEQALVDAYKGIRRKTKMRKNKTTGLPEQYEAQDGKGRLFEEYGIRKSLLDDLYIRFFRLAEERFGASAEKGILSFISNSSFLTGRSHPVMRESLLGTFSHVWVDNLHGNAFAKERAPDGRPDGSVFTTSANSGIRVGVAITTWLKGAPKTEAPVSVRDYYGTPDDKRAALLAGQGLLPATRVKAPVSADGALPTYAAFTPTRPKRFKLVPYGVPGGYEDWPGLDELFPRYSMGLNSNRGLTGAVIETEESTLASRFNEYFSALPWSDFAAKHPVLATPRSRYVPEEVRKTLSATSQYDEDKILPYLQGPLDARFIYYEEEGKLISERSPDVFEVLQGNEFLLGVSQPRRASESRLALASSLYNLHYQDRGTTGFFALRNSTATGGNLQFGGDLIANLHERTWGALRDSYGLSGDLEGEDAKALVPRLFRLALALGHAPRFESDHGESLAQDWLHLPIPRDRATLDALADAGDRIAVLLDPLCNPTNAILDALGEHRRAIGTLRRTGVGELDPRITYGYFGSGRGRYEPGPLPPDERLAAALGPLGRVYLNPTTYLDGVGERVWRYELGGYPVLKKWLGYRDAKRRDDRGLTTEELDHAVSIIRRLSTLLLLHPTLDALYNRALEHPFTAEELGLR